MSKQLEIFIKENKENFDDKMPSPGIWENIMNKLNTSKKCDLPKKRESFLELKHVLKINNKYNYN